MNSNVDSTKVVDSGNCQCKIYVDNRTKETAFAMRTEKYHKHIVESAIDIHAGENKLGISVKGTSGTATGANVTQSWKIGKGYFTIKAECPFRPNNKSSLEINTTGYIVTQELVSRHGPAVVHVKIE